jgi:hypothetical protein
VTARSLTFGKVMILVRLGPNCHLKVRSAPQFTSSLLIGPCSKALYYRSNATRFPWNLSNLGTFTAGATEPD